MSSRAGKSGAERQTKRKSHARPDRIIEKRQNWQDYMDPDEDPGLLDEDELVYEKDEVEGLDIEEENPEE